MGGKKLRLEAYPPLQSTFNHTASTGEVIPNVQESLMTCSRASCLEHAARNMRLSTLMINEKLFAIH